MTLGDSPSPFATALEMAAAIRDGRTTSRQLVEMHIERIERLDAKTNAVVVRRFEEARTAADAADACVKEGKFLGIFHGVPMTVKETLQVPGTQSTVGIPAFAQVEESKNYHRISKRMIEAGAIILGKTNLPTGAFDWDSANPIFGATHNPYDLTRTPGGSSGGSGASLAAGFAPLEIGSDIAGSIRVPAAFCGVVGHVATEDVVPRIDDVLGQISSGHMWMGAYGPMARTAEDAAAILKVIGGSAAAALPLPNKTSLGEYSVAVWRTHEGYEPSADIASAMENVVSILKTAGSNVEELVLPMSADDSYALYLRHLGAQLHPSLAIWWPGKEQTVAALLNTPLRGRGAWSHADVGMVLGQSKDDEVHLKHARYHWEQCLRGYDAVLCPVVMRDAWPHATSANENWIFRETVGSKPMPVDDTIRRYDTSAFWEHIPKLCGLPATSFPVGKSRDGLPLGLQLIGKPNNDFFLLEIAGHLMRELGTVQRQAPPGFEDTRSRL